MLQAVLALGVLSVALNLIVLVKIEKLFQELRTPIVKKLGPDLKLKPRQPGQPNPLSGNRPQGQSNQGRPLNAGSPRPQGDRPQGDRPPRGDRPQGDRPQGDRNQQRDFRGDRGDRGGQSGRRDDRRRDRRDRNDAPLGNDAFGRQAVPEAAEMDPPGGHSDAPRTESRPESENQGRPSFEGRRPLTPRVESPAAEPVSHGAPEGAHEEGEGRQIRYGRRPMGKKAPSFDEPAAAAAPSAEIPPQA